MITNEQIANAFDKLASLIEFLGENDPADAFRIRAYRKAANVIRGYPHNIHQLWKSGQLKKIPGL
jgi:DNA polymerase/3'-5' exonuclease PolX